MRFLHALSELRNPVFDAFFSVITYLGGEVGFLVIAICLLWCGADRLIKAIER